MQTDIEVEELIDADLKLLWQDERFVSFCQRPYLAPRYLKPESLLFIGINPSYTEEDLSIDYYDTAGTTHPYFQKFQSLAQQVQRPWSHLDLLFFRETDQKQIHSILKAECGVEFIWQQLQLSKRLITAAQPAAIVVCNALARTLLGGDAKNGKNIWLGLDLNWNEQLGTYLYNSIPVFFNSMLTGQRALDRGSYERLAWHIRFVLSKCKA